MSNRLFKLLSACLASLVLFSFVVGCGDKGPKRVVDDKDIPTNKDPNAR
jgi:predicted small lipoprotein YifL